MKVAKQVIVMRKDLNMRKGKMVAQGSHASLGAVLLMQAEAGRRSGLWPSRYDYHDAFDEWINGSFTKVCVSVNSESQLMDIFHAANDAGLPVKLITDAGNTEFHGVPTRTCLAIGPAWAEDIDRITGKLALL
jgi:PTH2 family peptidyl-tRNA hydrolase